MNLPAGLRGPQSQISLLRTHNVRMALVGRLVLPLGDAIQRALLSRDVGGLTHSSAGAVLANVLVTWFQYAYMPVAV